MPYIEYYPAPGQAVCAQIDDKPERVGLRYPVDVPLVGDARATLAVLLPLLPRNDNRDFLIRAQEGMKQWWELMEERGTSRDTPMKPQVPAWAFNNVLADDAIICGDSGTVTTWAARQIRVRRGQQFSFSGTNCSMAAALPYAIGAAAAFPGRQVLAFTGDGSMTMQLGDFLTAVQHELPIKIVVEKNNSLGLIKWEQMVFLGNPEYGVNMAPLDFAKFAEAAGARGMCIEDPATPADALFTRQYPCRRRAETRHRCPAGPASCGCPGLCPPLTGRCSPGRPASPSDPRGGYGDSLSGG
jgi:pyruvate dehydrogenase (quinone)